jgi:hypothetical protein
MDIWRTIAERKIREAMDEGEFENLAGTDAPLALDEDPFTDPSLRMAHRLLKNNGFAPAWIEEGKDIDADVHRLREELRRSRGNADLLDRLRARAAELNRRIASYNVKTPVAGTQKLALDIDREIERAR